MSHQINYPSQIPRNNNSLSMSVGGGGAGMTMRPPLMGDLPEWRNGNNRQNNCNFNNHTQFQQQQQQYFDGGNGLGRGHGHGIGIGSAGSGSVGLDCTDDGYSAYGQRHTQEPPAQTQKLTAQTKQYICGMLQDTKDFNQVSIERQQFLQQQARQRSSGSELTFSCSNCGHELFSGKGMTVSQSSITVNQPMTDKLAQTLHLPQQQQIIAEVKEVKMDRDFRDSGHGERGRVGLGGERERRRSSSGGGRSFDENRMGMEQVDRRSSNKQLRGHSPSDFGRNIGRWGTGDERGAGDRGRDRDRENRPSRGEHRERERDRGDDWGEKRPSRTNSGGCDWAGDEKQQQKERNEPPREWEHSMKPEEKKVEEVKVIAIEIPSSKKFFSRAAPTSPATGKTTIELQMEKQEVKTKEKEEPPLPVSMSPEPIKNVKEEMSAKPAREPLIPEPVYAPRPPKSSTAQINIDDADTLEKLLELKAVLQLEVERDRKFDAWNMQCQEERGKYYEGLYAKLV